MLSIVADDYSFTSQLSVLQGCLAVISRLLRHSGSSLLAAKVLVVARLLDKALASSASSTPLLTTLHNRLASLRLKLLKYIDKTFANPHSEQAALVESMHSFCLATSSTPTDVLRHFHHIRSEAISNKLQQSNDIRAAILEAMKLFIGTLQDTQSTFPRRLATALETSKTQPLLKDPNVMDLVELQLDIHGRWITEDIQRFTPRPRHDQLQKSDAEAILQTWASKTMKSFLSGLHQALRLEEDLENLLQIRRELLDLWLSSLQASSTSEAADVLDGLRKVMTTRIAETMRGRTASLRLVVQAVSHTISHWQTGITDPKISLWESAMIAMDMSSGVAQGTQNLLDRCHGRSQAVNEALHVFDEWMQSIQGAQNAIKKMKEMRWDQNPDDIADEILAEPPQVLLSNKDPKILEEVLQRSISDAFDNLAKELDQMEKVLANEQQSGEKAVFLLRILRELRQQVPKLGVPIATSLSTSLRDTVIEPTCHTLLAASVCIGPTSHFHKGVQQYLRRPNPPARALWEGNPPLPIQPSPAAFKFLREVMAGMGNAGHDLWNPTTVQTLKVNLENARASDLLEVVNASTSEETSLPNGHDKAVSDADDPNGTEDGGSKEDGTEDSHNAQDAASPAPSSAARSPGCFIQLLFDVFYLYNALRPKVEDSSGYDEEHEEITSELSKQGSIDKVARQRLEKSASDYWKKTYLLFALLA